MSRFFNSNALSFAAGVLVGSASSYFYCKYSRDSSCKKSCNKSITPKTTSRSDSSDEEDNSFVKEVGRVVRV
jgi:hypothetical protein